MTRTPENLIEIEIPEHFAAIKGNLSDSQKAVRMKFGVDISGTQWTLSFADGELSIKSGSIDPDFDIAIYSDQDSFDAALNETPELQAIDPSKGDLTLLKPELAGQLREVKGTLGLTLLDIDETLMGAKIKFGSNAPDTPTCDVKIQEADVRLIASGKLNPQQAFMSGKVRIDGDMALVMQLSALAMM